MSSGVISSTMFIWLVLMAIVTWSGAGSSSASMCRVSSLSHLASAPSPSGLNEIDPPTCRIISGTASRSRPSSSLNIDIRLEPLPSSSRTWMCSTVAPAFQQSTACWTCSSMVSGRSSRKSSGSHSGPYGAAVMTTGSWTSGKSASSWKCMGVLRFGWLLSEGLVADDPGALHLANVGEVVLDGVVLRAAVVPDGEAVGRPAPADLVLRHRRLADQVVEQLAAARAVVEPEADVPGVVVVREVGRERVDEQHLLAGLRVRAHHRVLGVREALVQGQPLLDGHVGAEGGLDAVPRTQVGDLLLDVLGQPLVGLDHVHPDGVAADGRALDTAEHRAHRRGDPPARVAVEG